MGCMFVPGSSEGQRLYAEDKARTEGDNAYG